MRTRHTLTCRLFKDQRDGNYTALFLKEDGTIQMHCRLTNASYNRMRSVTRKMWRQHRLVRWWSKSDNHAGPRIYYDRPNLMDEVIDDIRTYEARNGKRWSSVSNHPSREVELPKR